MKKANFKKGFAFLMSTLMGTSFFAATSAGSTMAMFRSCGNSSLEDQCTARRNDLASFRNQRRQALQAARRQENANLNQFDLIISLNDYFSSSFTTLSPNANDIYQIILRKANERGINVNVSLVKAVAIKLDSLGFSSNAVLNMIEKNELYVMFEINF